MIHLYLEAPFAVFRSFTAGWYRPSCQFLTPSAAYGLLLNLARVEMRLTEEDPTHPGDVPASLTKPDLPRLRLALGIPTRALRGRNWVELPDADCWPRWQSLFQQLHNYPVGTSGREREAEAKGNKYNITPVRREFLSNFRCTLSVECGPELEAKIVEGLRGGLNDGRYGLPFLGDNSFLPDRLELVAETGPNYWLLPTAQDDEERSYRVSRATLWIDRSNAARTRQVLLSPSPKPTTVPEPAAWFQLPG